MAGSAEGSGLGLGTWGFGVSKRPTPGRRVWKEAVSVACLSNRLGVLGTSGPSATGMDRLTGFSQHRMPPAQAWDQWEGLLFRSCKGGIHMR